MQFFSESIDLLISNLGILGRLFDKNLPGVRSTSKRAGMLGIYGMLGVLIDGILTGMLIAGMARCGLGIEGIFGKRAIFLID